MFNKSKSLVLWYFLQGKSKKCYNIECINETMKEILKEVFNDVSTPLFDKKIKNF